ncbi:MAG: sulfatase-like hydrolase/transferase [Planctomycetaceae bacterium]|nr:sulfatase-like hydrolase/transferase [Planctomycetaceae bacterium]
MNHLCSLFLSVLLVLCGTLFTAAAERPNVLFLFADDMRADSIGALGNPTVKTPHLDALVRRGFAMRNAYCFGGNSAAVCTPSRNMLLSGNAFFRWKDYLPPSAAEGRRGLLSPGDGANLPLSFRDAGYTTYHHGKKGNTATLIQAKFDVNKYLTNDEAERKSGEPGREIADDAIAFLKDRPAEKPFLMYLAFGNPHDPRVAAKQYLDLYDPAKIPLPANYRPQHPFDNGEMTVRDEKLSPWPRTETEIRRTLHEYYATITALDHHIGRLLASLKERGLADNTIVVFSADQGISVGSHGLLGKQNLYDAAMKSPLVFAGPGVPHGESASLVHLFDIYPTLCELAGFAAPEGIDGRSFQPVIAGRSATHREALLLAYRDVQRAYRDERWKVIRYPQVDVTQLFDLAADPDERHDLAGDAAHKPRIEQMLRALADRQRTFGDALPLSVPRPRSAQWPPPTE